MGSRVALLVAAGGTACAALIAETLWIRALGRSVGSTAEAMAAVAAVVLAGLGGGAALGGRWAARTARPLRSASLACAVAGAWIALSPVSLAFAADLHEALLGALDAPLGPGAGTAALVAVPFLLPPTLLLGAVVPLLVRARAADGTAEARWGGAVYGTGTVGAALGPCLAVLGLAFLGESASLRAAGIACVVVALLLAVADRPAPARTPGIAPPPGRAARAVACGTGFAALLAQGAWLRLLGPVAGTHAWGVAALLLAVLLATGAGALAAASFAPRASLRTVAFVLVAASVAAAASVALAGWTPWIVLVHGSTGPTARVLALVLGVLVTVAPACFLFGAAYPLTVRAANEAGSAPGASSGEVFGWNAAGAVAGGLAGGFLLLPRAGAPGTLLLAAAVLALVALLAAARSKSRALATSLAILPLAALATPPLQRALLEASPSLAEATAASEPMRGGLRLRTREDMRVYADLFVGSLLDRVEGRSGTVALLEEPGVGWRLRRGEMPEGRLDPLDLERPSRVEDALGLLPAAMHPRPRRALLIGHGLGWTLEALLTVRGLSVDVSETDAAVLEVAQRGRGALSAVKTDPRARWIPADGRLVLRRASVRDRGRYDLVVSQPSRPWATGSSALFTAEAFREAREALAPGGLLAQWIDAQDAGSEALGASLAAFHASFPESWGFRFDGDLVLIGFTTPPRLDPDRWASVVAGRIAAGRRDWDGPADLFKHVAFDAAGFARILEGAAPATSDDRPRVELDLGLDRLFGRREAGADVLALGFPQDVLALLPESPGPAAESVRERWAREATARWLAEGRVDRATFWSTHARWGAGADALRVRGDLARASGDLARAADFHRAASEEDPGRPDLLVLRLRALGALSAERPVEAASLERAAVAAERWPDRGDVLAALARMWADALEVEKARDTARRALAAKAPPAPVGTGTFLARLLLASGEADERTVLPLLRADAGGPDDRDALRLLRDVESRVGDAVTARRVEAALTDWERRRGAVRQRAGETALRDGRWADALEASAAATDLLPTSSRAWEERALALLAWAGDAKAPYLPAQAARTEAVGALQNAVQHAEDPGEGRTRARAILRWHGLDEARLDAARSSPPAEGTP